MFVRQVLNSRTHCLWPGPPVELPVDFAHFLSDLATYMWHAGLASEGREALNTAIHIMDDEKVDKTAPIRGDGHAKLGILTCFIGVSGRRETLEHRKQALDIRHKECEGKPKTNEIALALPIMEVCYTKYNSWDTEENIPCKYAKYYAVKYAERGSNLVEKAASPRHPVTQQWRLVLGMMAFHAGPVPKSLETNQSIPSIRKERPRRVQPFHIRKLFYMCRVVE
ncbi:MAG: hypothetical protein Q9213_001799 [Squamulea squamosa]